VPGNHDVDLAQFVGTEFLAHPFFTHMRAPFIRELGGKRFRFFHGHEVDPFNAGDDPGFGRMLAIFAGLFEDQNRSPFLTTGESVKEVLEQFGDSMLTLWTTAMASIGVDRGAREAPPTSSLTPAQNPDRLSEHVSEVRADVEKGGYDVAVLGHTHKPGRIGDWYYNSGTWTGSRNSYLRLAPDGHVRYLEWKEGHAVEREIPVVVGEAKSSRVPLTARHPIKATMATVRTLFPRPRKPERSRWILMLQGAIALGVSMWTLSVTVAQGSSEGVRLLVRAFAAYAIIDGALSLLGSFREQSVKRFLYRARGIGSILLGLVIVRRGYAVDVIAILVGVWAFVTGALRVAAAVVFRRLVDSKWLTLIGAGSMLAGLALCLLPSSAALLKLGVAGYLAYYGTGELLAGIFGQRQPKATAHGGHAS
jgi:uncharacterized membrane protein HdeD (DUF308 family)/predicted phosphodiesterase